MDARLYNGLGADRFVFTAHHVVTGTIGTGDPAVACLSTMPSSIPKKAELAREKMITHSTGLEPRHQRVVSSRHASHANRTNLG